jgi:hypothetical protein
VILATFLFAAAVLTTAAVDVRSPRAVLTSATSVFWKTLAATFLAYAWYVLLGIVIIIVAALAAVPFGLGTRSALIPAAAGAILAALVVLPAGNLVAMIVIPVMIVERLSPWKAFTRSIGRVRRTGFIRAWLVGLTGIAIIVIPALMLSSAADYVVASLHFAPFRLVEQFLGDAVALAFGAVFGTVVALDMRARTEGADLEAEIGGATAPAAPS